MAVGGTTIKHFCLPKAKSNRFVVPGYIDGRRCQILLDSGASATIISEHLVSKKKLMKSNRRLFTANGSQLAIIGAVEVNISLLSGECVVMKAEVSKTIPYDCILGTDGLAKMNVTLHFRDLETRANEEVTALSEVLFGEMSPGQKEQLDSLLRKYAHLFDGTLGSTSVVKHKINTGDRGPVYVRPYRVPPAKQSMIDEHITDMLEKQIILPSSSAWNSPIVLTKRKDGKDRFCIDYRGVNKVTVKDGYPLPRIDDCFDNLTGTKFLSTLDLASGYWQVQIDEEDRKKTAFSSPSAGHFEFVVMPFGLSNAPATFQRLMSEVMRGIKGCKVYLDDILIHSETWNEHLEILEKVFKALVTAGLKLQAKKCHLVKKSVEYLGHVIEANGIHTDPYKTEAIAAYPRPRNEKELRGFPGFANYYRRFVKDFSKIAEPLFLLTRKNHKFLWTNDQDRAFVQLKQKLTSAPVLAIPDFSCPFELYTDASGLGMGSVLSQRKDGVERPIAFASRHFSEQEKKYSATEKEAAAIVWALTHFHPYLYGAKFSIVSDHEPLKWLFDKPITKGRLARWQLKIKEYDGLMSLNYRPGNNNQNADFLSRMPLLDEVRDPPSADVVPILDNEVSTEDLKQFLRNDLGVQKCRHRLQERNELLWFKNRLYVPEVLRQRVMESFHGAEDTAHLGVQKVYSVISQKCYWPNMLTDIQEFIRGCVPCGLAKEETRPSEVQIQNSSGASYPFEKVAFDFTGPFPPSADGNRFLLVAVDQFSRFVYVLPTRTASSCDALQLLTKVCTLEGRPKEVLTDQGRHFLGEFDLWLKKTGIIH